MHIGNDHLLSLPTPDVPGGPDVRFFPNGFATQLKSWAWEARAETRADQGTCDMSVPNLVHLDPQRGGCCTVMPYFIGDILELPVTTTQDYSLFHILNDYSINLWKQQTELIMEKHGLMSFIIHPDYISGAREQGVYKELLTYLSTLRDEKNVWIPTSSEVNRWWRQRRVMNLVPQGNGWRIEGEGRERARIAYASEHDGQLVYSLTPQSQKQNMEEIENSF